MDFGVNIIWFDLDTNVVRKFSIMFAGSGGGSEYGVREELFFIGYLFSI